MRVRISTISPRGLEFKDKLSLDALNARMAEGSHNDILFTSAPEVNLTVFRTASGAETKGTAVTTFRQACGRCLEPVDRRLVIETNYVLAPRPEDDRSYEDDVGITYYDGDHVELDGLIEESFILALNPFWNPPLNEDGVCVQCGKRFPEKAASGDEPKRTLGALFKKAGIPQKDK